MMIGATNATIKPIIANNANMIVVILAHLGKHYVWSHYSHNKRNHGSTAVGKYSSFSGVARPGVQSKASAPKARGGNKTFYSLH